MNADTRRKNQFNLPTGNASRGAKRALLNQGSLNGFQDFDSSYLRSSAVPNGT
jgi:hypothetical protein